MADLVRKAGRFLEDGLIPASSRRPPELTRKERKQREALRDEYDALMAEHDQAEALRHP
ncbi:hypothetical protein [Mesorhizobium sp. 1B3]|uniref:hypothetical protein n=1 Tax=Mesorhizobium sp. 1B3 TaxID=3243599 RepID=UPI003D99E223